MHEREKTKPPGGFAPSTGFLCCRFPRRRRGGRLGLEAPRPFRRAAPAPALASSGGEERRGTVSEPEGYKPSGHLKASGTDTSAGQKKRRGWQKKPKKGRGSERPKKAKSPQKQAERSRRIPGLRAKRGEEGRRGVWGARLRVWGLRGPPRVGCGWWVGFFFLGWGEGIGKGGGGSLSPVARCPFSAP